MAKISQTLSQYGISIEAILQKEPRHGEDKIPIILLTDTVKERILRQAMAVISTFEEVSDELVCIRMNRH